jgi:hypothetical protein
VDLDELEKILLSNDSDISMHDLKGSRKEQNQRMKHAVISCGTAMALAEETNIDADLVFSCASLRQLGLNLVAYNYPHIYNKAFASMSPGEDLEEVLQRSLGFSPAMLGYKSVLNGNISGTMRTALGYSANGDASENVIVDSTSGANSDLLTRLCDIGESFARVNDPEHYPNESANWEQVVDQINSYLGPKGLSIIGEKLQEGFSGYMQVMPDLIRTVTRPERHIETVHAKFGSLLFQNNTYIAKCNPDLQERFRKVYNHITPDRASNEAVALLMTLVFPFTGFLQGCIYLVDQKTSTLTPRMRIGASPLSRYKPLNCSLVNPDGSPIVEALYCRVPIKQENVFLHGELVSHISGALGNMEPIGVLYLEVAESPVESGSHTSLVHFRAVRQCLMDCMAVK